jgi:two-component system, chemotaxis family, CheB/CheR fusion protein
MPQPAENPFLVVGVGASAGGLGPLKDLVGALPPKSGVALVIIQHLDPRHESRLGELLQPHAHMPVVDASHGLKVKPDHAYVIQPNTSVALADGVLSVTPRPDDRRPHYPVDHFLRSLAAVQGSHAVGVILSGTGSDGTLGMCEIKAAGGVTFAQDEASAQHAGMPQSAIASGAVDLVLPPDAIGTRLAALKEHPYLSAPSDASEPGARDGGADEFPRVIAALRATTGVDFSEYRDSTIKRRTARRMLLRGFTSPADYARFIERDRDEANALYRDVLINVTSFFRDPEMFEDLKRTAFPAIVNGKADGVPVRVWVPGCSTGQEAYSLAIALLEFLDTAKHKRAIQIFATDLGDPAALDKARAGLYPESIEAEVSAERLRRFFTKEDRHYRIQKSVRDMCVFARQNVTVDPPFSRVDLVTCRNVMIYMSPPLQERLLPVFHFALNPGGFLVLGQAETVGSFGDLFELTNGAHKIYRRRETGVRPALTFMADDWLAGSLAKRPGVVNQPADFQREADRLVVSRYVPPSVLVNHDFEVQQFRGRTSPYLEAPSGHPTTNILRMAREGLFMELRSALTEAKAANAPVVRDSLHVRHGGADIEFTLRVLPIGVAHSPDCCFLVLFESKDWPAWSAGALAQDEGIAAHADRDASWLRQELASTKQYLQSIVDQQEAAAQELRAAHEEVLSSNEELQSTNEELETTKEELQSSNEELTTINEQFLNRNRELDGITDDLSNFISSADLPMVTVGRDLRIRRLTPAAQRAFNLLPTDVGRSLEHIKFSLAVDDIGGVVDQVISSVHVWEREVVDRQDRWWLLRVLPFRTADNRIDGATLVAVDIDLVRRSHELMEARDNALAIVQAVREPLVVLGDDCRIRMANDAFYALVGEGATELEDKIVWETGRGIWNADALRQSLKSACGSGASILNLEIERFVLGRSRRLVLNTRRVERDDRPSITLLSIDDVTDARQAEALRIDAETLRLLDKRKDEFLGILAHELRNPLAPMTFALELLRRSDGMPAEIARARQVLDRQVGHMVRIVDDLLDVSRITQGKVELRKERLELATVVTAAVELSRPAIDAAGHALTVSLPDEPIALDADPVRLTQVLVNLLNNAVKFTPTGGHIWLIAETVGDRHAGPDELRIRIRDTGVGIKEDVLPRIFDMFMQGDLSLERTRAGLGVGLTLVKNLVSLHGGTVEARSSGVGSGSEFTVCLPLDPKAQPVRRPGYSAEDLQPPRALRILIADDNDDGREMLGYLLGAEGHSVALAPDGPAAIETAESFHPEVIVLDIGMPGMNGYAVARILRQKAWTPRPAMVALSGLGQQEDKARAAEAGFDRHFTKPVDLDDLRAYLATVGRARPD